MGFLNFSSKKKEAGFSGQVIAGETIKKPTDGSSPYENVSSGDTAMDDTSAVKDRSVKINITRDDAGCKYAYENDAAVFNSVSRKDNIINNGFVVKTIDPDDEKLKEGKLFLENRIAQLGLQDRVSSMITNKATYGFSVTKVLIKGRDIIGLVDISSDECVPIRDLNTGMLGGESGKGLDPNSSKEVAIIQKGNTIVYDATGESTTTEKYFYFANEEIISMGNNDRGMYKGVSDVMRSIRYVEIKKTLENVVDIIARRFGPQIWVTVGNENHNLSDVDIPSTYLRDGDGNLVDPDLARKNYKSAAMTAINTEIQQWVDGDSLVQLAEYGVSASVINPSSKVFPYREYIELMADFIKTTILGLDTPGRVDVTSGEMQDKLTRDIRDSAIRERNNIMDVLTLMLFNPILEANGYEIGTIFVEFEELDMMDEERDARIEELKSKAIYNYMKGGFTKPPDFLIKKWGLTEEDVASIITQTEQKEELKEEKEENPDDPAVKKKIDDLNRGR